MDTPIDYDAISLRLAELQTLIARKIGEHSQLLKAADRMNWGESATARADTALAEIDALWRETDGLIQQVEKQLVAEGYSFTTEPEAVTDEPARWWKEDLKHEAIPVSAWIEDTLEAGLGSLISRLPPSWWRRQQELRASAGYARLCESVALYGGVAGSRAPTSVHRYAYALMLAQDTLEKRNNYDIYEGSWLIPFVAALCTLLGPLREVKGGYEKLDQLLSAPGDETESRLYEIIVAARCASLGRQVEFLDPGAELTPDLRVHDLGFPAVVECKMQSRLSHHERLEFDTVQHVFRSLAARRMRHGLVGDLMIIFSKSLVEVPVPAIIETALRCTSGIDPYQTVREGWGSVSFAPLPPSVDLGAVTRLYSPDFMEQVFGWNSETSQYDGICAFAGNNQSIMVGRAELPFCLKWRSESPGAIDRKARSLASQLSEAFNQIPVGEAAFIYLAYQDVHRAAVADHRTQRYLDMVNQWEIRKRGINPQRIVLNRLYPNALHEGRPNLVESAIPTGFREENVWAGTMPTRVFTIAG